MKIKNDKYWNKTSKKITKKYKQSMKIKIKIEREINIKSK